MKTDAKPPGPGVLGGIKITVVSASISMGHCSLQLGPRARESLEARQWPQDKSTYLVEIL